MCLSSVAPELCGVYLPLLVVPARVPGNYLFAQASDVSHHFRNERGVCELYLIGSDMDPWHVGKHFSANFIHQILQYLHSLFGLHVDTSGTYKGGTVPWHVYLRNQQHVVCLAVYGNLTGIFEGIVLPRQACEAAAVGKLRIAFAFQSPSLVLGEVPVKNVYFKLREQGNLSL
ncbi:hypothetical protein SDC9_195844 [bioreactor metagenome]|uniref:Uncharacterized protein n=1 Tax=bioreactor metagenome TaxID=1076179 RepID=A0A645ICQ9_9ZZZZ